ncbi:MAG TPA: hypothetical protein VJ723_02440 [Candidatus Angelobacter sp.]|nr:hypothetical protein [Candidatus Angelobacter sp.]
MNVKKAVITLLLICGVAPAQGKGFHRFEQSHFTAEDASVRKPVRIPEGVLAVLRKDEVVGTALENENIPADKMPLSWFSASAIHLSNPEQVDLVVMAVGTLRGSNMTTFWVFCATAQGYELVLRAPAHDLMAKNTRWKRHRDIELTSMTAVQISTVLCRFDGERYTGYRTSSQPIR